MDIFYFDHRCCEFWQLTDVSYILIQQPLCVCVFMFNCVLNVCGWKTRCTADNNVPHCWVSVREETMTAQTIKQLKCNQIPFFSSPIIIVIKITIYTVGELVWYISSIYFFYIEYTLKSRTHLPHVEPELRVFALLLVQRDNNLLEN